MILNRTVRWTPEGIVYRADEKRTETILKYMGLEVDSKTSALPVP